jgi:hypothetical protein
VPGSSWIPGRYARSRSGRLRYGGFRSAIHLKGLVERSIVCSLVPAGDQQYSRRNFRLFPHSRNDSRATADEIAMVSGHHGQNTILEGAVESQRQGGRRPPAGSAGNSAYHSRGIDLGEHRSRTRSHHQTRPASLSQFQHRKSIDIRGGWAGFDIMSDMTYLSLEGA